MSGDIPATRRQKIDAAVMGALRHGPLRFTELYHATGVSSGAVGNALKRLEIHKLRYRHAAYYFLPQHRELAEAMAIENKPKRSLVSRWKRNPSPNEIFTVLDAIPLGGEKTATELSKETGVSMFKTCQSLLEAVAAGLVNRRETGSTWTGVYYSLNPKSPHIVMIGGVYKKKCRELGWDPE